MVLQRLLSDFGRPKSTMTTNMAEEEAAQLHERRAAELKRLDLCGRRPFPKVGRPTLQSLYENALILQVLTGPDSTKHITDKTVLHGWKRGMSVVADVQEVFACAGHAVIEKHEQDHELAAAEPPHKKQRTRVARHHTQWFLSMADRLHVHGWKKKDVFMNCQRTYNFDETCLCLSPTGSHGWWWKGANKKAEFQRPSKQAVTVTLVTSAVRAQFAAQCIFHGTTERVVPDLATDVWMTYSHNNWVHRNSAAAVLEDGGNGERTYSCTGLCCAHGHGAYPHQCRDQTDAARGVRPHSRHHDPSTYNELFTAFRCGVDAPIQEHDSNDGL